MTKTTYPLRTEGGATADSSHNLSLALNEWLTTYGPTMFKTCDSCKFMTEQGPAYCSLYNQTPPASVIIAGCPSHTDKEEIPF